MPFSVLRHVSKVFKRIIYHQISNFMTDELSKQLPGFRKIMARNTIRFLCWEKEKDNRSRRVYLCNLHGSAKSLSHI